MKEAANWCGLRSPAVGSGLGITIVDLVDLLIAQRCLAINAKPLRMLEVV